MRPARAQTRWPAITRVIFVLSLALALSSLALPTQARADVVDDAYAAGSEAATRGDWHAAIEHWQRALELLPGRSAQLEYDLGTAYAQVGELGLATYHLERSLQPEARPGVELAEAARRNLGIVRRRAEVAAELGDARISRHESSWDLVVAVLAGRAVAWVSMIAGWLMLAIVIVRAARRRRVALGRAREEHGRGISGALVLVFSLVLGIGGALHALAIQAANGTPDAVVIDELVDVREAPGTHLPVAFSMQGGSRVRLVERRSGWVRVRMPGGLEGWARASSIAPLDQPPMRSHVRGTPKKPPQ